MYEKAYSISEVSQMTGIKNATLRNWEEEFKGFLEVSRDKHGSRLYTKTDIDKFLGIQMMRKKGLTLIAIRNSLEHLKNNASSDVEVASTSELSPSPLSVGAQSFPIELKAIIQEAVREELTKMFQQQSQEIGQMLESRSVRHSNRRWWMFWK